MKFVKWGFCLALAGLPMFLPAQDVPWDDTRRTVWPTEFELIDIPSSADNSIQKAYFYRAENPDPQPLIVSLHTWSGDYAQKDPLVKEILLRGWNYIHPDFRGANNKPESTGSRLVISDIGDAIRHALANSNADPESVHVIGVSGGGMAALAAYMNLDFPVKSFSAWAPVSDLEAWYWESVGRQQKYAQDVLSSVSADGNFDAAEARRRSPLHQQLPGEKRRNAQLYLYEGIHDGYTGSVPITHAIRMYNRLAEAAGGTPVPDAEMLDLVTKRCNPAHDPAQQLNDRAVYLRRDTENIHLTIFEGGHEMLPRALSMVPVNGQETDLKLNIFTIGDSNGALPGGWVNQLKTFMPESNVFNLSQGGRTIGFDNNNREELNALRHVDSYLDRAAEHIGREKYDYMIVCLGTNDTKPVFAARQDEVPGNFEKLLDKIIRHRLTRRSCPHLIFVTPPPLGSEDVTVNNTERNEQLGALMVKLTAIAENRGLTVVDVYHPMLGVFHHYAPDGTHMVPEGQRIVAAKIREAIESIEKGE